MWKHGPGEGEGRRARRVHPSHACDSLCLQSLTPREARSFQEHTDPPPQEEPHAMTSTSHRQLALTLAALSSLAMPAAASAQAGASDNVTNYVPAGDIQQQDGKRKGFDGVLSASANINMASNSHVVGQVDGFSLLLGFSLLGGLDYIHGPHEWRNTLRLTQAWARTPVVNEFIKANDVLDLESVYHYFFLSWMGAFGRINMETAMLPAEDVRTDPATYLATRSDGTTRTFNNTRRLELSGAFAPLTFNQSGGLFAEVFQSDPISVSLRLGVGARETFSEGVLVITDDNNTPTIELTELDNVYQSGVEAFISARGGLNNGRVSYEGGLGALLPVLNNDPLDRGAAELTRVGLFAHVSFHVFEWMSLDYHARLLRDPQLLDEIQLQNNLLFTFQYTFIERTAPTTEIPVEAQ
jgi:hypothetical protein